MKLHKIINQSIFCLDHNLYLLDWRTDKGFCHSVSTKKTHCCSEWIGFYARQKWIVGDVVPSVRLGQASCEPFWSSAEASARPLRSDAAVGQTPPAPARWTVPGLPGQGQSSPWRRCCHWHQPEAPAALEGRWKWARGPGALTAHLQKTKYVFLDFY